MYYMQINGAGGVTLDQLKITSARFTRVANGIDFLDFSADSSLSDAGIVYGSNIWLYDEGKLIFICEVTDVPSDQEIASPGQKKYRAKSYLHRLEKIQYTQEIRAWNPGDEEVQTYVDPRVILGLDSQFNHITNIMQIRLVLLFAIANKGWPGVYDGSEFLGGYLAPLDQKENISCWDAIVSQLRWLTDYVLWCDYSSGITWVRIKKASDIIETTLSVSGEMSGIRATPRHDLQMVGVNVYFRKVMTVDGSAIESRTVQSAGDSMDPLATNLYVDLDGGSTEFIRQAIVVEEYPSFDAPYSINLKLWVEGKAPWLKDIFGYTISSVTRSGTHNYTKELLEGVIHKWMPVSYEEETITVKIVYDIKDEAGNYIERAEVKVPVKVTSCNGTSKTYSNVAASDSGEAEPEGLAAGIYSSWSMLHWDGSISSYLSKTGYIGPGNRINIIGAHSSLASMGAIVQSASIDLQTLAVEIQYGTCRRLEADTFTALYRAIRYRRFSTRLIADSGEEESVEKDETSILATPKGTVAQSPGIARKQIGTSSTEGRRTSLSSEDLSSNEEAKLRSISIPGGSTAKVLATSAIDVLKWDSTAPSGYEWEVLNIVLDNKIVTREVLVKTSSKADVFTWSSSDERLLLQVKGGTGADAGKLRVDKGYLKT